MKLSGPDAGETTALATENCEPRQTASVLPAVTGLAKLTLTVVPLAA